MSHLKKLSTSEAAIGKSVNSKNPRIHGEMNRYPASASRRRAGLMAERFLPIFEASLPGFSVSLRRCD